MDENQKEAEVNRSMLDDLLSCVFQEASELQEKLFKATKLCGNITVEESMKYKTIRSAYERLDEVRNLMRSAR